MDKRALIVDDDIEFVKLANGYLTELGYKVQEAMNLGDGLSAALEANASQSFDFILCDVQMPDASGVELIRALRKTKDQVPLFVFATAFPEASCIDTLLYNEADYILVKPFTKAALEGAVRRGLERKQDREFRKIMKGLI